ncbi:MAG: hypothetical protein U0136_09965 [Bdellovibrionota bacterium]
MSKSSNSGGEDSGNSVTTGQTDDRSRPANGKSAQPTVAQPATAAGKSEVDDSVFRSKHDRHG